MRMTQAFYPLAAALALSFASSAGAAIIVPVSVTASSSFPGYPAADAIDQDAGFEISDWASFQEGPNAFLNLDLGAVYTLDEAYVTDRVTSGGANNGFVGGLFDFTTRFSLQAFSDAAFTSAIGSALVFDKAAPGATTQPSDFLYTAALGGLTTRYVQYKVLAANGVNPGVSDIRFSSVGVPEPTTWAFMIMGFGGAGALLRRRRAAGAFTA